MKLPETIIDPGFGDERVTPGGMAQILIERAHQISYSDPEASEEIVRQLDEAYGIVDEEYEEALKLGFDPSKLKVPRAARRIERLFAKHVLGNSP